MIIGIDFGNKCGMAWKESWGRHRRVSCVCRLSTPKEQKKHIGARYAAFQSTLEVRLSRGDVIFYEDVRRHLGTQAAHVYGGYLAILEMVAFDLDCVVIGIPVGTIKKHATGKGNASKQMMIEAARNKLGYKGNDDNEADALWILDTGIALKL